MNAPDSNRTARGKCSAWSSGQCHGGTDCRCILRPPNNQAPTSASQVVPVTSVTDGRDHAVTLDAMAAGIQSGTGRYSAICRAIIEPAALAAPPGLSCPACRAALGQSRVRAVVVRGARSGHRHRQGNGVTQLWAMVSAWAGQFATR